MSASRLLAAIAAGMFLLAAFGAWPSVLSDAEPIALGLSFFAASHVV